jgi:hypothetical protein
MQKNPTIPNPDTCWLQGISACERGVPRDANPYAAAETLVDQSYSWFTGWDFAKSVLELANPNAVLAALQRL